MAKIFVSVYPFGRYDQTAIDRLKSSAHEVVINPLERKLSAHDTAELAADFDGIIAGTEDLTPLIQANLNLKMISRVGIGLDSVPLQLCRERGIKVSYTPDAVTGAVAELTVGAIISLLRHVCPANQSLRTGDWSRPTGYRISELKTGILGFGRVGTTLAKLLAPFEPKKIFIHDIQDKSQQISQVQADIESVTFTQLLKESDILTLHVPLTPKTRHLIDLNTMSMMKPGSYLINFARGAIINEEHLLNMLHKKHLRGAALDVFEQEPYKGPLTDMPQVLLTQHMGSCSYDCRYQMELQATEEILRFFNKEPLKSEVPEIEYLYQVATD